MQQYFLHKDSFGERSIIQDNEIDRGYADNYIRATAAFERQDAIESTDLITHGFQKLDKLFTPEQCAKYIEQTDGPLSNWVQSVNKRKVIPILDEIITTEVDKAIISHFKSEYIPTTIGFSRTEAKTEGVSSHWHYDGGPTMLLIMILYLTDSEADGSGTTIFVDRKTSDVFTEKGYAFCPLGKRVNDIGAQMLADHFDVEFKPINLNTKAGDAIIFDARHILHRGCYPKNGPRYSIVTSFIPYYQNWKAGCNVTFFPRQSGPFEPYPKVTW